jgi:hypothetical protein
LKKASTVVFTVWFLVGIAMAYRVKWSGMTRMFSLSPANQNYTFIIIGLNANISIRVV